MLRAPGDRGAGPPGRPRGAARALLPHLYDPDPALRNVAIQAVVAIEQRATAAGESLDPEVQAALRREDLVDHLLVALLARTTPRTAARPPSPWAG